MKRILLAFLLPVVVLLTWGVGFAGDFYVIPVNRVFISWDKKLPGSERFKLVFDGEAVLDKETGLVWEQRPLNLWATWVDAITLCYEKELGGRKGWRLPTIEELASLVDVDNSAPALPAGHPFDDVGSDCFWSSTTFSKFDTSAQTVEFEFGELAAIYKGELRRYWCVRGGHGHDAY